MGSRSDGNWWNSCWTLSSAYAALSAAPPVDHGLCSHNLPCSCCDSVGVLGCAHYGFAVMVPASIRRVLFALSRFGYLDQDKFDCYVWEVAASKGDEVLDVEVDLYDLVF